MALTPGSKIQNQVTTGLSRKSEPWKYDSSLKLAREVNAVRALAAGIQTMNRGYSTVQYPGAYAVDARYQDGSTGKVYFKDQATSNAFFKKLLPESLASGAFQQYNPMESSYNTGGQVSGLSTLASYNPAQLPYQVGQSNQIDPNLTATQQPLNL